MTVSNIKAVINSDVQRVWDTITNFSDYSWRSDLSKTEVLSDSCFVEYSKNSYPTSFTVTVKEPYKRWEFKMENSNMSGHWIGIFTPMGHDTQIDFTEEVTAKKLFMKPFIKVFLHKQQTQFIKDLNKTLEK